MAITFVAAGAAGSGGSGNVTPGLPTGWAADDIHCLVVSARDNVVCTLPAGWTKKIELNNTTGQRLTFAWRRAVAGDVAPLVTHTAGANIVAQISGFRGAVKTGDPFDASGSQGNASSATITAPAITPLNANDMILFVGAFGGGATVPTVSGYSGTNPTFAEAADSGQTNGISAAEGCLAYGVKTDTTTTGSRTATATQTDINIGALLAMQSAALTGYGAEVLVDAPKVYWRVGEASGNAIDSSGNTHDGAVTGTTRAVAGAIRDSDKAIQFNGGTNLISVANHADYDFDQTEAFTLEFWAKWSSATTMAALAKRKSTGAAAGYTVYFGSDGTIHFQLVHDASVNNFLEVQSDTGWSDNRWHHIASTYDGSTNASGVLIYVDGVLQPMTTLLDALAGATIDATAALTAGALADNAFPYTGQMDEAAVYAGALSAARVAVHAAWTLDVDAAVVRRLFHPGSGPRDFGKFYTGPRSTTVLTGKGTQDTAAQHNAFQMKSPVDPYSYSSYQRRVLEDGPLAYWRQGDRSGTVMGDQTGNAPGTYASSGVTLGVTGALGDDFDNAATYDGATGYAQAAIDLSSYSQITLEFLLRVSSFGTTTVLFELTSAYDSHNGGFVSYVVDPGRILAAMWDPTNGASSWIWPTPGVNSFHHYVYTFDRHAGIGAKFKVYVDGQSVGANNGDSGDMAGNFASSVLNFMARDKTVFLTAGDLDEVAIYSGLLSPARIAVHAAAFVGIGSKQGVVLHPGLTPSNIGRFWQTPRDTFVPQPTVFAAIADAALRFRMSARGFKDVAMRAGVAVRGYADVGLRARLTARAFKDIALRARLSALTYKDVGLRASIGVRAFKDVALRARLSALTYKDAALRFRLSASAFKDIALRFRLSARAFQDVALRLRLAVQGYKDVALRARLSARAFKDLGLRFTLLVGTPAWKDIALRFRLLGLSVKDIATRFRLSALAYQDVATRFRLIAQAFKDIGLRVRLSARAFKDVGLRFAMAVRAFKDVGLRATLVVRGFKDIGLRARLTARSFQDVPARFRLSARAFTDAATRFRLGVLGIKDVGLRARLIARSFKDVGTRLVLAIRGYKDIGLRARLTVLGIKDTALRVRLMARSYKDVAVRFVLTPWAFVTGRIKVGDVANGRVIVVDFANGRVAASDLPAGRIVVGDRIAA